MKKSKGKSGQKEPSRVRKNQNSTASVVDKPASRAPSSRPRIIKDKRFARATLDAAFKHMLSDDTDRTPLISFLIPSKLPSGGPLPGGSGAALLRQTQVPSTGHFPHSAVGDHPVARGCRTRGFTHTRHGLSA